VRFYFTGTEFLYDHNANLSKAVAAKRLPLTILCSRQQVLQYVRLAECLLAGPFQSQRPREGGVHHGRIVEVEGASLWVDFRPRYITEAHFFLTRSDIDPVRNTAMQMN